MHAHSDYVITIYASEEEKQRLAEFLVKEYELDAVDQKLTVEDICRTGQAQICQTYKNVFLNEISGMLIEMAHLVPKSQIRIVGVVDTTESAGELQDFEFSYQNGTIHKKWSDWYIEMGKCYEDYEGFCEEWDDDYDEDDENAASRKKNSLVS